MVRRPAPGVKQGGLAAKVVDALGGITDLGRTVPPEESFVTFFPSLWHVSASAIVPARGKPREKKGNTVVSEVEFLEPLAELRQLRLGSVCSSSLT